MNKVYPDAKSALEGVLKDNMMIMSGGFGLCGIAEELSDEIRHGDGEFHTRAGRREVGRDHADVFIFEAAQDAFTIQQAFEEVRFDDIPRIDDNPSAHCCGAFTA